jgi:hypothetical protein
MKINFNYILNYLKKHKFILFFVIILILIIILFNFKPVREGLTGGIIGEYEYLAPLTQSEMDEIDVIKTPSVQSTWDSFASKWNSVNNLSADNQFYIPIPMPKDKIVLFSKTYRLSKPQLDYYIQNGEFPWDGFVTNYFKQNPLPATSLVPIKSFSNAAIFNNTILSKIQNEPPLAVQIFKGTVKPPDASLPTPPM